MARKPRIPIRCRRGRHDLTYDSMLIVVVKRCKHCSAIPDTQQASMWEFEVAQINEHAKREDLSLRDRLRAVRQIVQDEMKLRNYVNIDFV